VLANNFHVLVFLWGSLNASDRIHKDLLNAVLGSPLRFFEVISFKGNGARKILKGLCF
jgi:hypothetical protein